MEQSDIDKLLALRSAWDKFKAIDRKASTFVTSRDFVAYYKVVWKYSIERKDEIEKFNDEMIMQLLREYRTVRGECDLCSGIKGEPPCVSIYGNSACAVSEKNRESWSPEGMYTYLRECIRAGYSVGKLNIRTTPIDPRSDNPMYRITSLNTGDKLYLACPEGHGFYFDYSVKEEYFPFEVDWNP